MSRESEAETSILTWLLPLLRVKSDRHVLLWTGFIIAISVAAPVGIVGVVVTILGLPVGDALAILAIAAGIPLLIAPPLGLFAMSMLRLQTMTLERIDAYVCFDTLTGVLTRGYLLGRIRDLRPLQGAFLMVDADHFKAINDTYGHDVGDAALKRIAEVLRASLPADALIGRLGGEEFGVYLPGADLTEAARCAGMLCAAIRVGGRSVEGFPLNVTLSVGGALQSGLSSLDHTMKRADEALYLAKRTGRDRFHIAATVQTVPEAASLNGEALAQGSPGLVHPGLLA